jgi:hypothetical protein
MAQHGQAQKVNEGLEGEGHTGRLIARGVRLVVLL